MGYKEFVPVSTLGIYGACCALPTSFLKALLKCSVFGVQQGKFSSLKVFQLTLKTKH